MSDIGELDLQEALAWGAIGFGATATLTPRLFEKLYGLHDEGELRVMTRLWGTRTAALGCAMLAADADGRRQLTQIAAVMSVLDTLAIATAGPDVKKSSRALGALTSAAFAAGYASVLGRS